MAKTIAAIDMLVKYLEHRIRNIKADTKEAYDIERGEIVDELKQLAERISNIDPIILPRLPKADLQDEVIRNIASAASKRTTMPPIYTDTTCNIGIQNIVVCLPKYVNFSETPVSDNLWYKWLGRICTKEDDPPAHVCTVVDATWQG